MLSSESSLSAYVVSDDTSPDGPRAMRSKALAARKTGPVRVRPAPPSVRLFRRDLGTAQEHIVGKRYRVSRVLGTGGMGTVYDAVDVQTGCPVALKALSRAATDIALQRLRREAEAGASIRSEHVVRVHYLGVDSGTPFIVMERLHGETLRDRLDSRGPLTVRDALSLVRQLLSALDATHRAGFIHRDVKPSNVFLTSAAHEAPRIKLIDFGLAKPLTPQELPTVKTGRVRRLTAPDGIPGTFPYLAPEQLLGGEGLDHRVDVYAAGLVLYEALTGKRPHRAGCLAELVNAMVYDEPISVCAIRRDVPEVVHDILEMALRKDPNRRFASAAAFANALATVPNEDAHGKSPRFHPKMPSTPRAETATGHEPSPMSEDTTRIRFDA